jgi:hypothetical protein
MYENLMKFKRKRWYSCVTSDIWEINNTSSCTVVFLVLTIFQGNLLLPSARNIEHECIMYLENTVSHLPDYRVS